MAMGVIQPNHISVNKYQFLVPGLPPLTVTKASGLEEELEIAEMPDRTKRSGGNTKAGEVELTTPLHHEVEQAALESWFALAKASLPGYKRTVTLIKTSVNGAVARTFTMTGAFPSKRKTSDLEMKNEGDMAEAMWTLSYDQLI